MMLIKYVYCECVCDVGAGRWISDCTGVLRSAQDVFSYCHRQPGTWVSV